MVWATYGAAHFYELRLGAEMAEEVKMLPLFTRFVDLYALDVDPDAPRDQQEFYMTLETQHGDRYRLPLSAETLTKLSEALSTLLQSEDSPLLRGSSARAKDH